jgi:hypothetical protein
MLLLACLLVGACVPSTGSSDPTIDAVTPEGAPAESPAWIDELITEFQNAPVGNPPQAIYRYQYDGQTVYYIPAKCCDIPSILYDATGVEICLPSGGMTGRGDGRCPDFNDTKSDETLIWMDSRTR